MKMSLDNTAYLIDDLKLLYKLSDYIIYDLIDRSEYKKKLKKIIKHLEKDPEKVLREELIDL